MNLNLERYLSNQKATLGKLSINGKFECFTLEDEKRCIKVFGETRIPAGSYRIKLRKEGIFHKRYSERFKSFHIGMLHLQDVPGFQFILIHIGNFESDSAGCILVGKHTIKEPFFKITDSALTYEAMYKKIIPAFLRNEEVWINITDHDNE